MSKNYFVYNKLRKNNKTITKFQWRISEQSHFTFSKSFQIKYIYAYNNYIYNYFLNTASVEVYRHKEMAIIFLPLNIFFLYKLDYSFEKEQQCQCFE